MDLNNYIKKYINGEIRSKEGIKNLIDKLEKNNHNYLHDLYYILLIDLISNHNNDDCYIIIHKIIEKGIIFDLEKNVNLFKFLISKVEKNNALEKLYSNYLYKHNKREESIALLDRKNKENLANTVK